MGLILTLLSSVGLLKIEAINEVNVVPIARACIHSLRMEPRLMSLHTVVERLVLEVTLIDVSSVTASAVQYLFLIKRLRCLMMLTVITARDGEEIQLAIVAHDLRVLKVLHVWSSAHVRHVFRVLDVLNRCTL
jgi:tRNA threonylcarbamoyladenosine modification (KEOPS) complex  Pcc1 subunit